MRKLTIKQLSKLRSMSRIPTILELNRVRQEWKKQELPEHVNSRFYDIEYPRFDCMLRELIAGRE